MADKEITIRVQLDGTKGVVKDSTKVQHSIRDIGDEGDKSSKQLNDMGQQSRFLQGRLGALGAIAGGAVVAGALNRLKDITIDLAKQAFQLATSVEETGSKYRTVLGPNVSEANEFLSKNARVMGLSITEGRELIATTTAIAQGFDFEGEAAAELGMEVVSLAGDLQSFNDVPIERTHNAITAALSGETEALKSLGIVIRQEMVVQKALEQTGKDTANALTQQERATATLALITEKAGVAVGDLERTQDSAANRTRQLQADLRTIAEIMSTNFMGSIEGVLGTVQPLVSSLREWVETPVVEELQNEQTEFNRLYTEATNVNTSQERRIELISQMKREYPEFLEGIDAETISNAELTGILDQVNNKYAEKINIHDILTPVQDAHQKSMAASRREEQKQAEMLFLLQERYRENSDRLKELGFSTDNWRERLQKMDGEQAQEELTLINIALDEYMTRSEAMQRVTQSVIDQSINPMTSAVQTATTRKRQLNNQLELAEERLLNMGLSQERVNDLLSDYRSEAEGATSQNKDLTDTFEFAVKILEGRMFEGLSGITTASKNLSEQQKENSERINELVNKTGELTEKEEKEIRTLSAQNQELQKQIDKRRELTQIPAPPTVEAEQPEDQVISAEVEVPDSLGTDEDQYIQRIYDRKNAELDLYELQQEQANQRQILNAAETESQKKKSQASIEAIQAEISHRQMLMNIVHQSAMAQIETGEDLLNHIANVVKQTIKARIAQAVAAQIAKVITTVPFPFNVAIAAAAGGAVSLLFENIVPDFEEGGVLKGPSHAAGGITIVRQNQPVAEAEGNEAIITTRATEMFYDELSAMNVAGGGKAFPGAKRNFQSGGPLGPVPSRPKGGFSSSSGSNQFDYSRFAQVLRSELESANITAVMQDSLEDLDERLSELENFNNRYNP